MKNTNSKNITLKFYYNLNFHLPTSVFCLPTSTPSNSNNANLNNS